MVGKFIDKILKFSETVHEKEWGKRMQEKKEFYDWLKLFVSSYLEAVQQEPTNTLRKLSGDESEVNHKDENDMKLPEEPLKKKA